MKSNKKNSKLIKQNTKKFLALFLAAAMSAAPVSYVRAEECTAEEFCQEDAEDNQTAAEGEKETEIKTEPEAESETAADSTLPNEGNTTEENTTRDIVIDDTVYEDGEYDAEVTSDFAMFKIKETRASVKGEKLTVRISTESASYDKIYIGNKEDEVKEPVVVGADNGEGGFFFTFELPAEKMGQQITFVPCSAKTGEWYVKKDVCLTLPNILTKPEEKPEPDLPDLNPDENQGIDRDGDYNVDVESDSAMFHIIKCVLTAKEGTMHAVITLSGTGYDKLFAGTKEAAEQAAEAEWISYVADAEGYFTFDIPVSSLDKELTFAAHAVKSGKWFDRKLTFKSENMTQNLKDGKYRIPVESSSAMFKVVDCVLTAKGGKLSAAVTLSGTGYDYLYAGTMAEAMLADKSTWIPFVENTDGQYTYVLPIRMLDKPTAVAAHSISKNQWYDRTLTFRSEGMEEIKDTIPGGSEKPQKPDDNKKPDHTKPDNESKHESDLSGGTGRVDSSTALKDGVYTPDKFAWSGGSGRVSISCSKVTIKGGKAYATLVFGSNSYAYVKANGNIYYPTISGNTSVFVVPVELNKNNRIIGMTTKMSASHEIAYTVFVYLADAKKAGGAKDGSDNTRLDETAPELLGLSYQSETEIKYADYFRIYHYDQGITLLEIDLTKDTARDPQKGKKLVADTKESGLNPAQQEVADLYKGNVIKYLIIPEEAEVPAGTDKEMIIVRQPKKAVYAASDAVLEFLDKLAVTDAAATVGCKEEDCMVPAVKKAMTEKKTVFAGTFDETDFKELVKSKCDMAILPSELLPSEKEELVSLQELAEKYTVLDIPMVIDRSADEKEELAQLEWIKVYGALFGCPDKAESVFRAEEADSRS